jgi:hypothetical protein
MFTRAGLIAGTTKEKALREPPLHIQGLKGGANMK